MVRFYLPNNVSVMSKGDVVCVLNKASLYKGKDKLKSFSPEGVDVYNYPELYVF